MSLITCRGGSSCVLPTSRHRTPPPLPHRSDSPLHLSCLRSTWEISNLLLLYGADTELVSPRQRTPRQNIQGRFKKRDRELFDHLCKQAFQKQCDVVLLTKLHQSADSMLSLLPTDVVNSVIMPLVLEMPPTARLLAAAEKSVTRAERRTDENSCAVS